MCNTIVRTDQYPWWINQFVSCTTSAVSDIQLWHQRLLCEIKSSCTFEIDLRKSAHWQRQGFSFSDIRLSHFTTSLQTETQTLAWHDDSVNICWIGKAFCLASWWGFFSLSLSVCRHFCVDVVDNQFNLALSATSWKNWCGFTIQWQNKQFLGKSKWLAPPPLSRNIVGSHAWTHTRNQKHTDSLCPDGVECSVQPYDSEEMPASLEMLFQMQHASRPCSSLWVEVSLQQMLHRHRVIFNRWKSSIQLYSQLLNHLF